MNCWKCGKPATLVVDEIWFDFGEPIMRFSSSKGAYDDAAPAMCQQHKLESAHELASAHLMAMLKDGSTGPLWPTRWWVKYTDGHVIGGDVASKPVAA